MKTLIPQYLQDATNFTGIAVKSQPSHMATSTLCPKCQGHGGWVLRLNAYGHGLHFNAACAQCNTWGWVGSADADCIHKWEPSLDRTTMFQNKQECSKCGRTAVHDSSG